MAGINVVFDSQYSGAARAIQNVDIATNMPIEQAFDYLAMLTHTFWKPISPNTIFVAEDNVTKRRDYEDEVVKVFYVTNVTSVQEFQEIATTIRTVAEIRRVFTYNAQKALIVRGTADQVALTEKLIHDLDKPKSEVVIDVIVMQVNSQYSRSLAATIASGGRRGCSRRFHSCRRREHGHDDYDNGSYDGHHDHLDDTFHDRWYDYQYGRRIDSAEPDRASIDQSIFDLAAGSDSQCGDVGRADQDDEQAAGASFGRHEGRADYRRAHSLCDGQFFVGRWRCRAA